MRSIQYLIAIVLITCAKLSWASEPLIDQVRGELKDSLYPIDSIIPGYKRPSHAAPRLAVAEFRISSSHLHDWSQAISEVLRFRIQYVPNVRLYMPAAQFITTDARVEDGPDRPLLTAQQHFRNLNQFLGIETVLTGSIVQNESVFTFETELVDAQSGEINSQKSWRFESHELAEVLIQVVDWVYQSLGVGLSEEERNYIADRNTLKNEAIEAFTQHYAQISSLGAPLKRDLLDRLQTQYPDFALLAPYVLRYRVYARNHEEAYKNIEMYDRLLTTHAGNAGVELGTYMALDISVMPKHEVAARLKKMNKLVRLNPHDPSMMIELASALLSNGISVDAIAILLEATERWPDNYRLWWTLGWAVNRHAWQVRGNSYWRDVPESAKGLFMSLTRIADSIIDRALELNQYNPHLWDMKINSLGGVDGYSAQLLEVFDKAVAVGPELETIYANALNFSGENWQGNARARRHIIETAEKNNPDAAWVARMRSRHAKDFERPDVSQSISKLERYFWDYYQHPDFWKFVAAATLVLLWLVYAFGKWAGRRETELEEEFDHDGHRSYTDLYKDRRE